MPTESRPFDYSTALRAYLSQDLSADERASARTFVARQQLPRAVAAAGWTFLRGQSSAPEPGHVTLIVGVAPWSDQDWEFLGALHRQKGTEARICVFDIDDCAEPGVLEQYVPGVAPPMATPVVAEFQGTRLLTSLEGEAAQRWLSKST